MMPPAIRRSRRIKTVALAVAALGALAVVAFETALRLTPLPGALLTGAIPSAEIFDRHGNPLRALLVGDTHFSTPIPTLEEAGPWIAVATVAVEDHRFYSHNGIDWIALARVATEILISGSPQSGASTITQQVVKLTDPGPRTVLRKFREMWLALVLERRWSKERILTAYLNRVHYGNLRTGVAAASRFYFGKPPCDLSPAEAALLAGLPQAPARLDPLRHRQAAMKRQRSVLARMTTRGAIDAAAHRRATIEELRFTGRTFAFEAPHFVDLLLRREGAIPPHGGSVNTTLDLPLQRHVEQALTSQLHSIAQHDANAGAAVVIHNPTGEVLALAGSGDYYDAERGGQFNCAWAIRSPGSAIKPFTYILALEAGANPSTIVADVPTEFPTPTGLYRPNNYNHRYYGPTSLRTALGNSLNVAAIRALQLAGGEETLHRTLRQLGISTLGHPASHYGLGLTLGNGEVRLLELANAYATLGRMGRHKPFRLLLPKRNTEHDAGRKVFDPRAAYLTTDMLSDNTARVASFGLRSWLRFDFPAACKTGTSSNYRDNWCVGYTPEFTVAVWVGNPDGRPMKNITGVTGAAPLMHQVLTHLHATRGTPWFKPPPGLSRHRIHPLTGCLAPPDDADAREELCLHTPPAEPRGARDSDGRILLSPEYAGWLQSPDNPMGHRVAAQTARITAADAVDFAILEPVHDAAYIFDPDLPSAAQLVPLRSNAPRSAPISWSCETLTLSPGDQATPPMAKLVVGRHRIMARNPATGATAAVDIVVDPL